MFRVLHIMSGADAGGISTVALNFYKYINREEFHFDIALTTDMIGKNGEAFKKLGSEIYRLPLKSNGVSSYEKALEKLLREQCFDAIHVHENETSYIALRIAKKVGIKCRVAHSHTSSPYISLKGELRRLSGIVLNYHYATAVIGCGQLAGDRVFGKVNMRRKKAYVLRNGIDTDSFKYDEEVRRVMRELLQVKKNYVVGMVGRLSPEKNHLFALDFFRQVIKEIPKVKLLIVGNGPEEETIRAFINEHNMSSYVEMLGRREDVNKLYQAFDVLIMPSKHEGFPVAAVEAMASGLPVLLSDRITKELSFSAGVQYIPLETGNWSHCIKKTMTMDGRETRKHEVADNQLDIRDISKKLEKIYLANNI